jgi:DNA-binding response OmpR family regulator
METPTDLCARPGILLAPLPGMLTILIAEDEPNIRELVRITLEDDRVRVIDAEDGDAALRQAHVTRPDLIFLDVNLPDMSGIEVCKRLRGDPGFAGTKIVMLTAAAQQADIALGLDAGADHYVTKPFSPVRLLSIVENLLPQVSVWMPE